MDYISEHKKGFVGTIIVHCIILILLFSYGFFTPLPLPGEEGILVNFGNDETGLGMEEPAPQEELSAPVQQEEKVAEPVTIPTPPKAIADPVKAKADVITQDLEKTASIEAAKKKKEEEKKRQEEIDRQKQIQEQKEKAEREQRQINEINSRAKNVFGATGQGSADSKSTSQGVTYKGGNQGSSNGTVNSDNYSKGGGFGNGPSYSLGGRSALALPLPNYPGNEEGVVVVQVTVDKNGNVTKAVTGFKGSTTLLSELLAAAQKAALLAKFNVDNNAPAFQQGTITYRFVLD